MKQIVNNERGSGGTGTMLLVVVGILVLWLIWELITKALGSGIEDQRRQDLETMRMNAAPRSTPRPVNHGGVQNHNVTFR